MTSLVVTRVHCGQTVHPRLIYSYYGTLIGNPTPGIQWYNFRPPGVTPNRGMAPPVRRFLSNYFDLLFRFIVEINEIPQMHLLLNT